MKGWRPTTSTVPGTWQARCLSQRPRDPLSNILEMRGLDNRRLSVPHGKGSSAIQTHTAPLCLLEGGQGQRPRDSTPAKLAVGVGSISP
jgi:hypothetical protein